MVELVKFIVTELVENKDAVEVKMDGEETITIKVEKSDMGRIIGKEGRIAKALRTIVKAAGNKAGKKVSVSILEVE